MGYQVLPVTSHLYTPFSLHTWEDMSPYSSLHIPERDRAQHRLLPPWQPCRWEPVHHHPGLWLVNKQIREECLSIIYAKKIMLEFVGEDCINAMTAWVAETSPQRVASIWRLFVKVRLTTLSCGPHLIKVAKPHHEDVARIGCNNYPEPLFRLDINPAGTEITLRSLAPLTPEFEAGLVEKLRVWEKNLSTRQHPRTFGGYQLLSIAIQIKEAEEKLDVHQTFNTWGDFGPFRWEIEPAKEDVVGVMTKCGPPDDPAPDIMRYVFVQREHKHVVAVLKVPA